MARLADIMRSAKRSEPATSYCPDANDIIKINFDPSVGREQAERRPALVLSPRGYNRAAQLCVLCPITNQGKGYPFEVALPTGSQVTGVALSDQVKSFSWDVRKAEFICKAPDDFALKVRAMIKAILRIPNDQR